VPDDPYQGLLVQKGGRGFPYLAFLDAGGQVLARQRGRSVEAFEATLAGPVRSFREARDLAATGDPDALRKLFLLRIELAHFEDFEKARAEMAQLEGLTDAEKQKVEKDLVAQEFNRIYTAMRSVSDAPDAGAKCAAMLEKGRVPTGRDETLYWFFVAKYAETEKNAELLEKSIAGLERTADRDRRAGAMIPQLIEALERIRKG
jgi:hypothetical protein